MLPRKRGGGTEDGLNGEEETSSNKKARGEGSAPISSSSVEAESNHKPPAANGMDVETNNGSSPPEIDEDLQLAVYGRETMRKLFASNVLVSGLDGLGEEIVELPPMATPLVSDQRKRAMEALERRFAADKAKSLQEEQRKNLQEERRRSLQEEQRRNKKSRRNPKEDQQQVAPAVEGQVGGVPNPKIEPSLSSSSKKGRLVYTGHAPPGESADPAYAKLSHLVHENLVGAVTEGSSNVDVVDNVVFNLIQHGDKGLKYTRGSIDMKIDKGLLLDNFVPRGGVFG